MLDPWQIRVGRVGESSPEPDEEPVDAHEELVKSAPVAAQLTPKDATLDGLLRSP